MVADNPFRNKTFLANIHTDHYYAFSNDKIGTADFAYIIPVKQEGDRNRAIIHTNNKTETPLLGVRYPVGQKLFIFDKDFQLLDAEPKDTNYLPLNTTDHKVIFSNKIKAPWYGLHHTPERQPVLFAQQIKNKTRICGVTNINGEILPFGTTLPIESDIGKLVDYLLTKKERTKVESTNIDDFEMHPDFANKVNFSDPRSIVKYLDEYVVGQNEAKTALATAFSLYMLRIQKNDERIPKNNVLLIGPTGVGKTYMLSLLAKEANIPLIKAKMTGKSGEGYVGDSISSMFQQLRSKTGEDAPYAICFLDEIDKLAMNHTHSEVFQPMLQDELIGYLDDAEVLVSLGERKYANINTKNILFVAAGAFSGNSGSSLDELVANRKQPRAIGFHSSTSDKLSGAQIIPEDIIQYGFKPELVSRLPIIATLDELTVAQKQNVLMKENSAIDQYVHALAAFGYNTLISSDVMKYIAEKCPKETGARGLASVCSDIFTRILAEPEKYADKEKRIIVDINLAKQLITRY